MRKYFCDFVCGGTKPAVDFIPLPSHQCGCIATVMKYQGVGGG